MTTNTAYFFGMCIIAITISISAGCGAYFLWPVGFTELPLSGMTIGGFFMIFYKITSSIALGFVSVTVMFFMLEAIIYESGAWRR